MCSGWKMNKAWYFEDLAENAYCLKVLKRETLREHKEVSILSKDVEFCLWEHLMCCKSSEKGNQNRSMLIAITTEKVTIRICGKNLKKKVEILQDQFRAIILLYLKDTTYWFFQINLKNNDNDCQKDPYIKLRKYTPPPIYTTDILIKIYYKQY